MADVKTVAVRYEPTDPEAQDVRFLENTSALHSEALGHRLSLVPMHMSRQQIDAFDPGDWLITLEAEAAGGDPVDVTTGDLRLVRSSSSSAARSGDEELTAESVFPADPISGERPILVTLFPVRSGASRQRVRLEARASVGSGRQHARWNPAAAVSVVPEPDESLVREAREAAEDKHRFDTIGYRYQYATGDDGEPTSSLVALESACGMPPEDIVLQGLLAAAARLRAVADDPPTAHVERRGMHELDLGARGGDRGDAELIQHKLLSYGVPYAGHHSRHVLDPGSVLVMTPPPGEDARRLVQRACDEIAQDFETYARQWRKAAGIQAD